MTTPTIAYFSMEIGIHSGMPTYAGGLGILAGDFLAAAADVELNMVGVSLLYHNGYFRQHLDADGNQTEEPCLWDPREFLELMPAKASLQLEGRTVHIQAWRCLLRGFSGHQVPVYFLDSRLPENDPQDQQLTDSLYLGDDRIRLLQEALLGLGGLEILRALGHQGIKTYHLNEGHSALLTLGLMEEAARSRGLSSVTQVDQEEIRKHCVFTTHTPVPAGHDQFDGSLVTRVLGEERAANLEATGSCDGRGLNMTALALHFSRYINGVAMRHGEISQGLYPNYPIESITNGVQAATWVAPAMASLFLRYIPDWKLDNLYLRHAIRIPLAELRNARSQAKKALISEVKKRTGTSLDPKILTLGYARRATTYKRPDFLFTDINRLKQIIQEEGPLQILYAGKAHPRDEPGKEMIRRVFRANRELGDSIQVLYLEEYDMELAKLFCSGVDVWLNTPQQPQEASGTSGMKAALNGVPSFSVLDGWWIEGHMEGVTGWAIGSHWEVSDKVEEEVESLYSKLENVILPVFYKNPDHFDWISRMAIVHNGSFFNAHRMVVQYRYHAYRNF